MTWCSVHEKVSDVPLLKDECIRENTLGRRGSFVIIDYVKVFDPVIKRAAKFRSSERESVLYSV